MKLHELRPVPGSVSESKRVGRGHGSGNGKTAGKGHKGQKARSGGSIRPGFEGGQMPLQRRMPKRGFNNIFAEEYYIVNTKDIDARFDGGAVVDKEELFNKRLIRDTDHKVKILGEGDVHKKLTVKADLFSKGAVEKITAAGGTAEQLSAAPLKKIKVSTLNSRFKSGDVIDAETLAANGFSESVKNGIIVTGKGELKKNITVKAAKFTANAEKKIKQAGGKAEVV